MELMMDEVKQKNLNKAAQVLLLILIVNIVLQLASVYQTKHVLHSPIIPADAFYQVAEANIYSAFVSSVGTLVALLFYFFKKPIASCVLALFALGLGQSYFLFF